MRPHDPSLRTRRADSLRPGRHLRFAAPVLLAAGLLLTACGSEEGSPPGATGTGTSATGPAQEVELATLLQAPERYDDQRVTTTGVADQLTDFVLALAPAGSAAASETATTGTAPVLTAPIPTSPIPTSPIPTSPTQPSPTGSATAPAETVGADRLVVAFGVMNQPQDGATVRVTGTVNDSFDVQEVQRRLDLTVDEDVISALGIGTEDAVLIADTIEIETAGTGTTSSSG